MTDGTDELLSVDEVVKRYKGKITKGTLANWRMKKDGPPFMKLGGRILYPLSLLTKWEAARLKVPPSALMIFVSMFGLLEIAAA
jgi:hypothetical protein